MEILRKIDLFQKEIHGLRPMEGEMLGQIQDYYRIGLTWTSNALEGNSLTESETKVLLEDGLTVGGKPLRDVLEAVDHARAYDFMFSVFRDRRIDEQTVLKIHGLFYQNIEPGYAGRYRDVRVLITGSQYPVAAPEKIQREMDRLFAWVQKEREGYHPVEFAAQLHKRFVFIHPFRDAHVIIGTRLEKPSKINGFALLSPIFLSHAGWREDGAVHINTYYTESQMGLCA